MGPRYRLRTLLILLAIAPPLVCSGYWGWVRYAEWRERHHVIERVKGLEFTPKNGVLPIAQSREMTIWHDRQEWPVFHFTIRDALWLTLVVALAVGWWVDRSTAPPKPRGGTLPDGGRVLLRPLNYPAPVKK